MMRSYTHLCKEDLNRLGQIARIDREKMFKRCPTTANLYRHRLFAVALCQGAALHFIDGKNGIKDFDVWSFYSEAEQRPFPYRRRGIADFGDPKFGVTNDYPHFIGRRVDLIGRSLKDSKPSDPVETLQIYLRAGKTETARQLSMKAVVLIEPSHLLGTVIWPATPLVIQRYATLLTY